MPPIERQHAYKVVEAFKIRANIPSEETAIEQRGRIRERTSVGPLDLRVQVTPSLHGQTVVPACSTRDHSMRWPANCPSKTASCARCRPISIPTTA